MAKGIFEEYYSQVAIIACVPKFSVQKARKGADKVTLLLLQEPKNALSLSLSLSTTAAYGLRPL